MAIIKPGVFPDTAFPDRSWPTFLWAEYGYGDQGKIGKRFVELSTLGAGITDYIPTLIGCGRQVVSIAGTSVCLGTSLIIYGITIMAEFNNTGVICVGGSNVIADEATRMGVPLNPGDAVIISIDDISKIWIDSTIDGDGVTYTMVE